MSNVRKWLIYGVAAIIAIAINIGSQWLIVEMFSEAGVGVIYGSILVGTLTGFIAKYVLDKIFVFDVQIEASTEEAKQILLYGFTGIFTTLIFWGVELGFHMYFEQDFMRYVGGVIGLTIGYVLKYILDVKLTFKSKIQNK